MFERLMRRWAYLEGESGDAPAGGAPAAAPAAPAAPTTPAADPGLTPPESLLNDPPAIDPTKPVEPTEPVEPEKPIEYEPFKMPEGVTVDEAKLADFSKMAAEARIPQDVAQKFVDLYSAEIKAISEAPLRAWTETQNAWRKEIASDPEIGGKNLDKNIAATKEGLKNLLGEAAPKFFEALNITGAGNNPEIIRGLFKAAQFHAPAGPVAGRPAGSSGKTAGSTLYPTMAGPDGGQS